MHIHADAVILSVRAHGEHGAIVRGFTRDHGVQPGYVRGGHARRLRPVLQPANAIRGEWRARTDEQLPALTVELLHSRAAAIDPRISIATVYRTVRLFEESGIIERHDFRDGRSRYEETPDHHHDHLIDMKSGKVVEFVDEEIEALQHAIARKLGYKLVDHRLELYGMPLEE